MTRIFWVFTLLFSQMACPSSKDTGAPSETDADTDSDTDTDTDADADADTDADSDADSDACEEANARMTAAFEACGLTVEDTGGSEPDCTEELARQATCLADCVTNAPCGALDATDMEAALALVDCMTACLDT